MNNKELIDALEKAVVELKKNAVSGKIESIDPHAENKALYELDALVHKEPWELWEFSLYKNEWLQCLHELEWSEKLQYRRKQTKKLVDIDAEIEQNKELPMLKLDQLNRLKEVCVFAKFHADCTYEKLRYCDAELAAKARKANDNATAALADIDAEIELLKGTS